MIIYAAVRQDPMHQRPTVPSLAVTEAIEALPDSTPTAKGSEEDLSLRSIELVYLTLLVGFHPNSVSRNL